MEINEKLLKPITEVNYLRAENVERYRVIIRYFYHEHENIHYWLYKEHVYQMMKQYDIFKDYTMEKCQSDLESLKSWGNLVALQDSTRIHTLSDYYSKQYRYQLSDYTIEIERMTIQLEHLEVEGASLEPTLLERIRIQILQIEDMVNEKDSDVNGWWRSLNNDFIRLNQNYQDYLKTLNSIKAEQIMKTTEFLVFKDKLITYLHTFVKNLQEHALIIEDHLRQISKVLIDQIFENVVSYELSIPRIDGHITREDIWQRCEARWNNLYNWFVGSMDVNEVTRLYDVTDETIRRITRYALQIGELYGQGTSRIEEYRHIERIFAQCENLHDAHCLSAMIFGVKKSLHFKELAVRDTDSIYSGVYEEAPTFYELESRSRKAVKKGERKPAVDYTLEKEMKRLEIEEQLQKDHAHIKALRQDGIIYFEKLPKIDEHTRKVLLGWLSKALNQQDHRSRNEYGEYYHIEKPKDKTCLITCEDGNFIMPCFQIVFEEVGQ